MPSFLRPLAAALVFACAIPAWAQRDLQNIPDPDPELERQTFDVAEGFDVNLYAADPMIAKPIQMNFDAAGRLWVTSSAIYPQIKPGQEANDKIIVLEDTDRDGRADKRTVFAEGLLIPTGVVPGDGGAYVANSTELLHLNDTDGDGRADVRHVVLSGFGTEDTHHILHTLRWGPACALYMNQSIYIHSHVETPYGVRRMMGAGIWRFRPESRQLEVFSLGLVNPWGHHFDRFGQSFATDGAGGEGINYLFPGWVGITSPGAKRVMHGLNPGSPKYCGLEIVSGRHLPEDWQGNMITNDFRAHRVCRFVVREEGSGFASRRESDVIKSSHVAFRPIDVKMGPDGAIYIADWYNPIIQHGEVDFRDPRRDHDHGRIWRITAKGRPLVPWPILVDAPVGELLDSLTAPEEFTRTHAKRMLKELGAEAVLPTLNVWSAALDTSDPGDEPARMEALWTYQSLDHFEPGLLRSLLAAKDHRIRAAATRVLSHWHDRLDNPIALLAQQVADAHPRVRLEAVRALARIQDPRACETAMLALGAPMDTNLDFALWTTARDLKDVWLPALGTGEIDFAGRIEHLTFALQAVESPQAVALLIEQLASQALPAEHEESLLRMVAALANPDELQKLFEHLIDAELSPERSARILNSLVEAAIQRKVLPAGDLNKLAPLADASDPQLRAAAYRAAGAWKLKPLRLKLTAVATSSNTAPALRRAAVEGLVLLGGDATRRTFEVMISQSENLPMRLIAVEGLAALDLEAAAEGAAKVLPSLPPGVDPGGIVSAFLSRQGGVERLAGALQGKRLSGDVARLALRAVRSSGSPHSQLEVVLTAAGNLKSGRGGLSSAEMATFLADVRQHGDPARGETVYRRHDQACMKCHAIGGAGGRVGPDLASIGASAPVDYLVESLLEPSKKIKENYHSIIVLTDQGKLISGVKVRQSDTELILRNADDEEVRVPLDSIDEQRDAGSLMPVGLIDQLTRAELVDLVRFLSELGKVGPYAVSQERVARRWQTLIDAQENEYQLRRFGFETAAFDNPALTWTPAYSLVDGTLPIQDLPALDPISSDTLSLVRCDLEVTTAGMLRLVLNSPEGLTLWIDDNPIEPATVIHHNFHKGRHHMTIAIDLGVRKSELRIELIDVHGSPAQAQFVGGK